MSQLLKINNSNLEPCSIGYSTYLNSYKVNNRDSITVGVMCRIDDLDFTEYAFLDTGARWTVIGGNIATLLMDKLCLSTEARSTISTRLGKFDGCLNRINMSLLASPDSGNDLTFEATVFVSEEWTGPPIVLGYEGFLQHIRFALDPGIKMGEQFFYFGSLEQHS